MLNKENFFSRDKFELPIEFLEKKTKVLDNLKLDLELEKTIDNKSLSSGQMQKIAFVRALLSEPDILILDESTANLDDASRKLIFELLSNKKVTIINSTHDPENFENVDNHLKIEIVDEQRKLFIN